MAAETVLNIPLELREGVHTHQDGLGDSEVQLRTMSMRGLLLFAPRLDTDPGHINDDVYAARSLC